MSGLILVTGATGSLGSRLARRLVADGHRVVGHGRDHARRAALEAAGIRLLPPDCDFSAESLGREVPDLVFNCAGIAGGTARRAAYRAANVTLVEQLVDLVSASGDSRLVHVSSPSVSWRPGDHFGIREDEPFTPPVSLYAWSRQEAEQILQRSGIRWRAARLRAVYGTGVPSMVSRLGEAVARGPVPLVRGGKVVIDLLHVDDAVEALVAIAAAGPEADGQAFNVAGPEPVLFGDLVGRLAREAGRPARTMPVPGWALSVAAALTEPVFARLRPDAEPPLGRHAAGALRYSQTLDLSRIIGATGWRPHRRVADHDLV